MQSTLIEALAGGVNTYTCEPVAHPQASEACEPPVTEAVRQLCSARLIAAVDTASKTPGPALVTPPFQPPLIH